MKSVIPKLVMALGLLMTFTVSSRRALAQNPVQSANAELRALFANLNNPNPTIRFLYDMSAKVTDSAFYTQISYDTSNVDNWYFLYDEMYNAAYDTTLITRTDTVFQRSLPKIQNDTIPIGIFEWHFNRLKPDALTTNNYFDFDTVNNILTDKVPQPISPYDIDTIFAASPLTNVVSYANVTFQLSPEFFFIDPTTIYSIDYRLLQVDFDDGNGWVPFYNVVNGVTENHSVTYATSGVKIIKVATFNPFTGDLITMSTSALNVLSTTITVDPNETITSIDGLDIGVYEGCQPSADKKYVIFLEGLDILNNRGVSKIYTEAINDENMAELQNFGYTFVVVNFNNPYDPIQTNGMRVVELLEHLKCLTNAPFVVVGESMGGLVGRYALLHMEAYGGKRCLPGSMHNTRLFMTIDSPHEGANMPLGIQQLYRNLLPFTYMFSSFTSGMNAQYGLFLDGYSSRQMLLYHVETDIMPGSPISFSPYGPSSVRTQLENDFATLGNYPRFCKMVALSNGALNGSRQRQYHNNAGNNPRQPNDYLMRLKSDTYLKILWFKILGANTEFAVRTNPDGNGSVLKMSAGISHWKLKLKWFGIKLEWGSTDIVKIEKTALDVRPYCVSAGSYITDIDNPVTPESNTNPDWVKFLGYTVNANVDDFGNVDFHSSAGGIGFSWFANINFDFISYSDGFMFGFIPMQSSFSYQASNPNDLDFNVQSTPVSDIMNRTPFDAVVTNPRGLNRDHLHVDNPELNQYATCWDPLLNSYLLTREIGDDSLYLESHRTLPHGPTYEAEQAIMVNYRNPYYNYPSVLSTMNTFRPTDFRFYIVAKENPLSISGQPISLRANSSVNINPFDPLTGPYQILPGTMVICCQHFTQISKMIKPFAAEADGFLDVYPNPNEGDLLWVKYRLKQNAPATAVIYNIAGQLVGKVEMPFKDNTLESRFSIDLNKLNLPSGLYILQMKGGQESYTKKFTVAK